MDNMLIEFWRTHECLFNSSIDSYYDKELRSKLWSEFGSSIGKPASDVLRRSKSLRTQYGRLLWHPQKINTYQQRMLTEKLDFLRPYIVRRRADASTGEKYDDDDEEEDNEEVETEGSIDQETGSIFGSSVETVASGPDPSYEPRSIASTPNSATSCCLPSQPQVTEVMSLNFNSQKDESLTDLSAQMAGVPKHDVLNQFTEIMLADMRQIKDPMLLMRLRRDITDLVFKAVEEDEQRRRAGPSSVYTTRGTAPLHNNARPQGGACLQMNLFRRQRSLERRNKGGMMGRRMQRLGEMQHMRRVSRSQQMQTAHQGEELERMDETNRQAMVQLSEIKTEAEPHIVKIEEVTLPVV